MSTSTGSAFMLEKGFNLFTLRSYLNETIEAQCLGVLQQEYDDFAFHYDNFYGLGKKETPTFEEHFETLYVEFITAHKSGNEDGYGLLLAQTRPEIIFHHNPVRDEVYARLINFNDRAVNEFKKLSVVVKDVEYYNGTDSQLEYMSEEEWDDLKQIWQETSTVGDRSRNTLRLALMNPQLMLYTELTLKNLRQKWDLIKHVSLNHRLSRVFASRYLDFYMKNYTDVSNDEFPWLLLRSVNLYKFEENNIQVLPGFNGEDDEDVEVLTKFVEQERVNTLEWVEEHPIKVTL